MPYKDKEKAKAYYRERYRKLIKECPEYQKEFYKKHRDSMIARGRRNHLKKYDLTPESYAELVQKQNNKCAICEKEEHRMMKTGLVKPLSVDHNHDTGQVRELLCNDCNAALGFVKEDLMILSKMAGYLQKHMQPDWAGQR